MYYVTPSSAGNMDVNTGVITWNQLFTGKATITATAYIGSCGLVSTNLETNIIAKPHVTFDPANRKEFCMGEQYTFKSTATNNSKLSYSVSPKTAGNIDGTGKMTWSASFSGITYVKATVDGLIPNCSKDSAIDTVYVIPDVQKPVVASGPIVRCQGTGKDIYKVNAANATDTVFTIDASTPGAGSIGATSGVMVWNPSFKGIALINVKVSSKNSCHSDTCQIKVTVHPATSKPVFSNYAHTICQNQGKVIYAASSSMPGEQLSYVVQPSSAGNYKTNSGKLEMDWDPNFTGKASIVASVTTPEGCGVTKDSIEINVQSNVGAVVFSKKLASRCQGAGSDTLIANAPYSIDIIYDLITKSAGSITNPKIGVVQWNPKFVGRAIIRATAYGDCGIATYSQDTITVNPSVKKPVFLLGANFICQALQKEDYFAISDNYQSLVYSLSPSKAGVIDTISGFVNWNSSFYGKAIITATAKGICDVQSTSLNVNVTPLPKAFIVDSLIHPDCYTATGKVYFSNLPDSGMWVIRKHPGNDILAGKGKNAIFKGVAPGKYQFTITNENGCELELVDTIIIKPQPTDFTPALGDTMQMFCALNKPKVKDLVVTNLANNIRVKWYDSLNSTTQLTDTASLKNDSYYYATLKSGVCESSQRLKVHVVLQTLPAIVQQPIASQTTFVRESAFEPLELIMAKDTVNIKYQWYKNSTNSYNSALAIPSATTSKYLPPNTVVGTEYYYCEVELNSTLCQSIVKTEIAKAIVKARPIKLELLKKKQNSCYGIVDGLIVVKISSGAPFTQAPHYKVEWKGPDGFRSSNDSISDLAPGSYAIHVTDSIGMVYDTTIVLTQPKELAISNYEIKQFTNMSNDDAAISIEITGGTPPYTYSWTNKNGLPYSNFQNLTRLRAGEYVVIVDDSTGCGPVEKSFVIEQSLYDNVFTPNGDGVNDVFLPDYELKVFSRNGVIMYQGTDGWDGRYKGVLVEPGSYIFQVRIKSDGETEFKSGAVTVVR
jgi:gliding motility-associated-like protein